MDRIHVRGLKVRAPVGVFEWERRMHRTLRIDLAMSTDAAVAAAEDRLDRALDYDRVCALVREQVASESCQLIETVAESLARCILRDFRIAEVAVTVRKPGALPDAEEVAVELLRRAADSADPPGDG